MIVKLKHLACWIVEIPHGNDPDVELLTILHQEFRQFASFAKNTRCPGLAPISPAFLGLHLHNDVVSIVVDWHISNMANVEPGLQILKMWRVLHGLDYLELVLDLAPNAKVSRASSDLHLHTINIDRGRCIESLV